MINEHVEAAVEPNNGPARLTIMNCSLELSLPPPAESAGGAGRRAFVDVYNDRYQSMVQIARLTTGSNVIAEDLVQDAFADLYQRYEHVRSTDAYYEERSSADARRGFAVESRSADISNATAASRNPRRTLKLLPSSKRYTLGGADPTSEEWAEEYETWCSADSPVFDELEAGTYDYTSPDAPDIGNADIIPIGPESVPGSPPSTD